MPTVPSIIMPVMIGAGHGVIGLPFMLQLFKPLWSCMSPGLKTPPNVEGARTQPLDSCMMTARMNRGSTPEEAETEIIADLMSAISSGELLAAPPYWVQEIDMTAWELAHLNFHINKSN